VPWPAEVQEAFGRRPRKRTSLERGLQVARRLTRGRASEAVVGATVAAFGRPLLKMGLAEGDPEESPQDFLVRFCSSWGGFRHTQDLRMTKLRSRPYH